MARHHFLITGLSNSRKGRQMFKMQLHPSPPLPSQTLCQWGEGTSAHLGAAAAKTNCFKCRHLRKEHLFVGTLCPRSTSHHKWLGVLFISYPPGILSCEKQTLYRGFLLGFYYFRKKAGSRTALSHHFKFLIFLLAFDFVLELIDRFFPVKPNLDTSSPLPNSTSELQSTGRDEGSHLPQVGAQISMLRNALLHLKPELNTFPRKAADQKKIFCLCSFLSVFSC